ncbi:MAG: 50S ribosomal protein L21 [Melioribacteraceae bacterium]|nr:50S ribosomal protein L21 [Melioribacteraceae bacterium]
MFAVVDIAGQQLQVEENAKYYVPRLDAAADAEVEFDNILAVINGDETKVGTPKIEGVKVTAKVLEHIRDDKVIVFKKKRRKGYRVFNGHRQQLTRIEVKKIG